MAQLTFLGAARTVTGSKYLLEHAGTRVLFDCGLFQGLKELRLRSVRIDDHDQQTKINHAKAFLADGHKVQFNLQFRGREMAHIDIGRTLMEKFKTDLAEFSKVEREPKLEGKRMIMILVPKGH